MLLAMNVLHDGAHRALSPWAWLDGLMTRVTAIPLGIEPPTGRCATCTITTRMPTWSTTIWTPPQTGSCGRRPFSVVSAVSLSASLLALIAALSLPYINWIYDWSDRLGLTPLAADRVLPGLRGWATFLSAKALHLLIAWRCPPGWHIGSASAGAGWCSVLRGADAGFMRAGRSDSWHALGGCDV